MATLPVDCKRRLIRDIKEAIDGSLEPHGIYYAHDETDMLTGYAMIVGQEGTPYYGGYYFFTFRFLSSYPYVPPIVKFDTRCGNYRFHPNLYSNGEVCLSILNTWGGGDPWSSCQTISSVLLTICMIMDESPLLHEPGITLHQPSLNEYNQIVEYINIGGAINHVIRKKMHRPFFDTFRPQILTHFLKNYDNIVVIIKKRLKSKDGHTNLQNGYYKMCIVTDYVNLLREFKLIKTEVSLENNKNTSSL
jgi:ubiquitin-protein ligase